MSCVLFIDVFKRDLIVYISAILCPFWMSVCWDLCFKYLVNGFVFRNKRARGRNNMIFFNPLKVLSVGMKIKMNNVRKMKKIIIFYFPTYIHRFDRYKIGTWCDEMGSLWWVKHWIRLTKKLRNTLVKTLLVCPGKWMPYCWMFLCSQGNCNHFH